MVRYIILFLLAVPVVFQSSGSVNDVPPGMIKDLDQGKAYLQIISGPDDKAVFRGNVRIATHSIPAFSTDLIVETRHFLAVIMKSNKIMHSA